MKGEKIFLRNQEDLVQERGSWGGAQKEKGNKKAPEFETHQMCYEMVNS